MFEKQLDLLTRKQCQGLLQVSKSPMLKLIQEGWIPFRKIADRYKIEKSDLIEFIENSAY